MLAKLKTRLCLAALPALCAALAASGAQAAEPRYEGISADGAVAFFSTTDKLVPGDTDIRRDVYERSFDTAVGSYVTRQVSFGPKGGNNSFDVQFLSNDDAGSRAFFSTVERLTATDTDITSDVYVRDLAASTTTLVSAGDPSCQASGCGNANQPAIAAPEGVVADGDLVVFTSEERLSTADVDDVEDAYVRDLAAGTTTLVSVGDPACVGPACGNGPEPAGFEGAAPDGSRAFFVTSEALEPGDSDALPDIYARDLAGAATHLVSLSGTCPGVLECTPVLAGSSNSGSHVFIETNERISGLDLDESQDLYDWSAGTALLASQGPAGGNGAPNALFAGSSPDGSAVFFETSESMVALDGDTGQDVYRRAAGETSLISVRAAGCEPPTCDGGNLDASMVRSNGSVGIPRGVFANGAKVFFFSAERLAVEDSDDSFDVYVRDVGAETTTLVSRPDPSCSIPECGEGEHHANLAGASLDGSHALFVTEESLVDQDTDGKKDIYDRTGGATVLVSTGTINGNEAFNAPLQGVSDDGLRAFFLTPERLTEEDDLLKEADIYMRSPSGTLLVSRGNDPSLEALLVPPAPLLESTDPASPGASTEPRVIGSEDVAGATIKLYATGDCSGEPLAIGTTEELAAPGIAVTVTAESTTALRATAESDGFVSGCSQPLLYTHEDSVPPPPPPPPPDGEGGGSGDGGTVTPAPDVPRQPGGRPYVTPVTRITFGPASKTRAKRPVFRFTDTTGQSDTRFVCRVDRGKWSGCSSPVRLKSMRRGKHVFQVLGINAVGVREERPSARAFKLVSAQPARRPKRGSR